MSYECQQFLGNFTLFRVKIGVAKKTVKCFGLKIFRVSFRALPILQTVQYK